MNRANKLMWAAGLLVGLGMVLSLPAFADNPAAVIVYRQKVMSGQAAHMGAIAIIVKKKLSLGSHVAGHARSIAFTAGLLKDIFPEGTGKGKTNALPKIWSDRDGFLKAAKKLQMEAEKLADVAASGDMGAIANQRKNVGKACGGCHKKFRQPKDKMNAWKKK